MFVVGLPFVQILWFSKILPAKNAAKKFHIAFINGPCPDIGNRD